MAKRTSKIRQEIEDMKVGDEKSFPIIRMRSIRTWASEFGIMFRRKYTTRTSSDEGLIYVLREA